jgi:hypothetical protein
MDELRRVLPKKEEKWRFVKITFYQKNAFCP